MKDCLSSVILIIADIFLRLLNNFIAYVRLAGTENKNKAAFIAAIILMVLAAFYSCYRTTSDLHWFYDTDFYRDMSYVQGALMGIWQRSNYAGAYLWYNPMLSSIETLIVKITGLPVILCLLVLVCI